jgi:hypothetical protein
MSTCIFNPMLPGTVLCNLSRFRRFCYLLVSSVADPDPAFILPDPDTDPALRMRNFRPEISLLIVYLKNSVDFCQFLGIFYFLF